VSEEPGLGKGSRVRRESQGWFLWRAVADGVSIGSASSQMIPEDKLLRVSQMDPIYAQAVLTIIAACSDDADARLLSVHPSPRRPAQKSELVASLRLVVPLPTLPHALGSSKWNTRPWTFQEHQLSRRRLVFTENRSISNADVISWLKTSSARLAPPYSTLTGKTVTTGSSP
jgi:hypothetical protein